MAKKRCKPTNPNGVQSAGEAALQTVLDVLAGDGLPRLFAPIRRGGLQIVHVPVKKPRACEGCPPLPGHIANKQRPVWRVYLIVMRATEHGGYVTGKDIMRLSKADGFGEPIPARTLGRAVNLLRELHEIHNVPGKGYQFGAGPGLFSAT